VRDGELAQILDRGPQIHRLGDRFGNGVMQRDGTPLAAQIPLRPVGVLNHRGTEHGGGARLHQGPGQLGHVVVGGVGLVRLQHRELGRVRGVDPLVPEVPIDLKDALDPTDDATLQEQFWGDPQIQIGVDCVCMGDEGSGSGPAVLQL
jgi:hypothetical protein